jgi:hypothetical protein
MHRSPTIGEYARASAKAAPLPKMNVTYLTDWNRKNANTLLGAITHHLRRRSVEGGMEDAQSERLAGACKELDFASNLPNSSNAKLKQLRSVVCSECRGNCLYVCDVASGWSDNCALIKNN